MSSNWISRTNRQKIYSRDSFCCVYCGAGVVDGETLSLDHLFPRSLGGCNTHRNLITCCGTCNSSKKATSVDEFLAKLEATKGISARAVRMRIKKAITAELPEVKLPRYIKRAACTCSHCAA